MNSNRYIAYSSLEAAGRPVRLSKRFGSITLDWPIESHTDDYRRSDDTSQLLFPLFMQ